MTMLQTEFKNELRESLLDLLWRQWSVLGVSGYGEAKHDTVVDPEALLIFSCSICRYDQRLFDAILDWLAKNERFINIQRLRTMVDKEKFSATDILSAIAAVMVKINPTPKWKKLAETGLRSESELKPLFYLKNGSIMPVLGEKDETFSGYGYSRSPVENHNRALPFPPRKPETMLLQIRALFGIGARSEALLYLILNEKGTISEIAIDSYYAWRSIQDALYEMGYSGLLNFPESKRGRFYRMDGAPWRKILLGSDDANIRYMCWPPLFRALEMIWEKVSDPLFDTLSPLGCAAELGELMRTDIDDRLERAGLGHLIFCDSGTGDEFPEIFRKWIGRLFQEI